MSRYSMREIVIFITFALCGSDDICNHTIYCGGKLLDAVQNSAVFPDSKTFVDLKLKVPEKEILDAFSTKFKEGEPVMVKDLEKFISEYFDKENQECIEWHPPDWKNDPKFIDIIGNYKLKLFAREINTLWKKLGRKVKSDLDLSKHSIIPLNNGFIVPGGRFREYYYSDSYWIVLGLLYSEMYQTVKGMLENFADLINKYGYIPNGGRIYYYGRSQQPMYINMVHKYYKVTGDKDFLVKHIPTVEKELNFWISNRTKAASINNFTADFAFYSGGNDSRPRPENYKEDLSEFSKNKEQYLEVRACAESGWDFSSRWFTTGIDKGSRKDTKVTKMIPVDLNSLVCSGAKLLSELFHSINDTDKSSHYKAIYEKWIEKVEHLWDETVGVWLDYDVQHKIRANSFYPSNLYPLWLQCFNVSRKKNIVMRVLRYLQTHQALQKGGIPASLEDSGENWDWPNAFPHLNYVIIRALEKARMIPPKKMAQEITRKLIKVVYTGYTKSKQMYDKYDVEHFGQGGGRGDYQTQVGFGWTNGVLLSLLENYGKHLEVNLDEPFTDSSNCKIQFKPSIAIIFLWILIV